MREIKFRAWNGKKMYIFSLFKYMSSTVEYQEKLCPSKNDVNMMQFTGLTDKNGKEIYEDDILLSISHTGVVNYIEEEGAFFARDIETGVNFRLAHNRTLEIIGNIHSNPELIK